MINQQLTDFIKQSLQQGVTKEKITSDLIANRWTPTDINEGFDSLNTLHVVNPPPIISPVSVISSEPIINKKNHSIKKPIFLIVGILFILALGASGYYFRNDLPFIKDLIKSDTTKVGELIQNQTNIDEIQTPTATPVVENNIGSTKTDEIDCGKDMTCFMNAIKTCSPSIVEHTLSSNFFNGFTMTIKKKMTLSGFDSANQCVYSQHIDDVNIDYSLENKATSEYKNLTEEQKKEGLSQVTSLLNMSSDGSKTIGMTNKCSFEKNYLLSLIEKLNKGVYSSADYNSDNCIVTDSNGKLIPYIKSSFSGGTVTKPSNEIDLYLNKQTIFSNKTISSSDLGFTLLEDIDDPNSSNSHIFKILIIKISTGEKQTITYYSDPFNANSQDHIFGVVIRETSYSFVSGLLNNGVNQTRLSIKIDKE